MSILNRQSSVVNLLYGNGGFVGRSGQQECVAREVVHRRAVEDRAAAGRPLRGRRLVVVTAPAPSDTVRLLTCAASKGPQTRVKGVPTAPRIPSYSAKVTVTGPSCGCTPRRSYGTLRSEPGGPPLPENGTRRRRARGLRRNAEPKLGGNAGVKSRVCAAIWPLNVSQDSSIAPPLSGATNSVPMMSVINRLSLGLSVICFGATPRPRSTGTPKSRRSRW